MYFFIGFFIISCVVSYVNLINILKKLKNNQDIGSETILGAILAGILAYCFIAMS